MRIKVTLQRAEGRMTDLTITADATATVGDVAAALFAGDPENQGVPTPERLTLRVAEHGALPGAEGRVLDAESDLLNAGLQSGSHVSLVRLSDAFRRPGESRGPAAAVVHVLDGPDAGREFPLPVGTSYLGRDRDMDVRLTDPLVSKRHARVTVAEGIEIADLNSANGLLMGGVRVARAALGPGDEVVLGDSTLAVVPLRQGAGVAPASPVIEFNRSPRVVPVVGEREIAAPEPPRSGNARKFPLVAMVAPLLMGAVMFTLTGNPLSLVFVALSPVIMIGTWLDSRITGGREMRAATTVFNGGVEQVREEILGAHRVERAVKLATHPSTAEVVESIRLLGPLLWSRRPEHVEFLTVRLGLGSSLSACSVSIPGRSGVRPEDWSTLCELATLAGEIDGVPVVGDFRSAGSIGLAGPRTRVAGVARAVALQLAALHSPAELAIAVLTSAKSRTDWEWTQWLPHTGSAHSPIPGDLLAADARSGTALIARIEEVLEGRLKVRGPAAMTPEARGRIDDPARESLQPPLVPAIVIIVDDDAPVDRSRLARLTESGPDVSIHVLWSAGSVEALPGACRAFLVDHGESGSVGFVRTGRHQFPVRSESISPDEAERLARALSPVEDASALVEDQAGLPRSVSFLNLFEPGLDPVAQVERWRESGSIGVASDRPAGIRRSEPSLHAVVGQAGTEVMTLDLRSQGPHALVGGTTGAGKSEFLQSWVLGMAVAHSPERVTFLLVDYKGGAAFADCVALPHTVGLVTDLSPHLVRRALTSLRAELRYREHLLNRKKVKDLISLERTGDPETPPSLVIVVDEFAALASEVPEFVDGVVDVAQRGRSLGLHLILATQRPAGVIKDNLRANTNLRIALRMADEGDSNDVLGSPMAAHFDSTLPGRGAVRTGPGRISLFQSAYAGGSTVVGRVQPRVDIVEMAFGAGAAWELPRQETPKPEGSSPGTDIERVVDMVSVAASIAECPSPRKPWLPLLANLYDLAKLQQRTDAAIALGVLDDPGRQEQRTSYFEPDSDGNLVVFGASGSGKSCLLRTLASAASITPRGGPVHIYGLDFAGGGLSPLDVLPNVGSIITGDDSERIGRLLLWCRDLVDERSTRFTAARAGTLTEYRGVAGRPDEARILVLVDGFGNFRQEYETVAGRSALFTVFQQLLVDGRSVGVHFAIAADRPGAMPTSVLASVQRKIVLRQSDETSYLVLDVPRDVLSAVSPPGRAIDAANGLELQVAVLGRSANVAAQARALEQLAASVPRDAARAPAKIRRLPDIVPIGTMPTDVDGQPTLGLADDTLAPVGFNPVGTFLVSGPSGSGRTTAVHSIALAISRWRPEVQLFHISGRTSPLLGLPLWARSARGAEDVAGLARDLLPLVSQPRASVEQGVVVCIESIADFLGGPAEAPLTEVIKHAKRNGHFVVAEADSSAWSSSWPLLVEVRGGRRGISLQPDQMEGDLLFRTTFPRVARSEFPPGRGLAVQAGKVRRIQLPLPY